MFATKEGELEEELREMMGDNSSHTNAPTLFDCYTEVLATQPSFICISPLIDYL